MELEVRHISFSVHIWEKIHWLKLNYVDGDYREANAEVPQDHAVEPPILLYVNDTINTLADGLVINFIDVTVVVSNGNN